jgi:signal transduction histidine kinase
MSAKVAGWQRSARTAAVVLAVLLAITLAVSLTVARAVDRDRRANLERRADVAVEAIERRLAGYTETLYAIRGLFEERRRVTRRAYRAYTRSLDIPARFPGIQVLAFAEQVDGFERRSYEGAVRRDVRRSGSLYPPGFRIKPPGRRPRHVVVSYLEPVAGNEAIFGLDVAAEAEARATIERAQSSGRPAATAPLRIGQKRGVQRGIVIYLPSRNTASPIADRSSGRFLGVAAATIRMSDFMRGLLPRAALDQQIELYDVGMAGDRTPSRLSDANLMYDYDSALDAPGQVDSRQATVRSLDVSGRRWSVFYETRNPLVDRPAALAPWLIAAGGALLSLLAAALVYLALTRRQQAEALALAMTADLRASQVELEQSNAELTRFAYVASHDLQEPLGTISGFLRLLERRYGDRLDDRARGYIGHATTAAAHGSRLIQDLLDYSRAGRSDAAARTPLNQAWDDAAALLKEQIDETGASVTREPLPPVAGISAPNMVRVFQNLISNGLRYRSDEPPRIHARAERADGRWQILVSDNGMGIPAEHSERIFVLFERLHAQDEYPGTGMGLAITRRIVETGGGRVWVRSQPGQGATFHLDLRAVEATR